ncbi:MAG: hypothetical protein GX410_07570, partial [Elusimicrobia bacterium]|nr:hypothetical protein [Elusimicrobiota bacterium]
KRFFITKDTDTRKVQSVELPAPGKADMGSYRHLSNYIRYVKQNFPADKYMLVVSNHGAGMYGISFDDVTGNNLKIKGLARAIELNGGVDVYASDACLMQMGEVVAALKGSAKVIVGSEETVPGNGFEYTSLLKGISANPGISPQDVGALVVDTFHKSYAGSGDKTTISAVDMENFDGFAQALNSWIATVQQSPDSRKGLVQAVQHSRSFAYPEFRDLRHFAEITARYAKDESVTAATEELNKAMDSLLLASAQRGYKKANGLAVYVPTSSKIIKGYEGMEFSQMTDWSKFLEWMKSYKLLTHDVQDAHK